MKLILTGGTGFLGSNLLKLLLINNFKVVVLKRSFSSLDRIDSVIQHPNLTLFDLDLENLDDLFAVSDIDFIIHTATEYGRSQSSIHALLETNFIYPMRLIELGVKYGVKGFINTDSYFNKKDINILSKSGCILNNLPSTITIFLFIFLLRRVLFDIMISLSSSIV